MAKGKKGTPEFVERLLNLRDEISEEDYKGIWRRLNRLRRNGRAWASEGRKIVKELEQEKEETRARFTVRDFGTLKAARKAAEIRQRDIGGRIVQRDERGRFSKRGSVFQVIGGSE